MSAVLLTLGRMAEIEIVPVPGKVRHDDVEDQADALADAAERLLTLLSAYAAEPKRSMDVIAVFRGLQKASASMAAVAAGMRVQEWVEVSDNPESVAAWDGALAGLRTAEDTYKWVADGWI